MRRTKNVIDTQLKAGETKTEWLPVPNGAKRIQLVFERLKYELPSENDVSEGEMFRGEFNLLDVDNGNGFEVDGWFGLGFSDDRVEGKKTPRPGQRMLWDCAFCFPKPGQEKIGVRAVANRGFNCTMHVDFS